MTQVSAGTALKERSHGVSKGPVGRSRLQAAYLIRKVLTDKGQDWRMKKVPYFAGVALAGVGVVAALNWGARIPAETQYAVPVLSSVSMNPETIQLFSAFGGHVETPKFPRPAETSSLTPEIKLPPKKLPQVQSTNDSVKSTTKGKHKRQPAVANSGHIL